MQRLIGTPVWAVAAMLLLAAVMAGCGQNVETTGGRSVYVLAANGVFAEVRDALEEGFDVNTPDADGRTLLHFAVAGNQPAMVEMLISNFRANAMLPDAAGVTATDLALEGNNPEILEVFYNEGLLNN